MKPLFVTGIDTGIGKTIVSAMLVEKLQADYWKPIQSGDLDQSDTLKVRSLVSNAVSRFHPETYRLTQPFSPHKSAAIDGIEITLESFRTPQGSRPLIVEGAGGLMVPLNIKDLMIDLIRCLEAEVIVVSKNYLGSINHTLLTLEMLKAKSLPVRGLIFNGKPDTDSEKIIQRFSEVKYLGRVPEMPLLNRESIRAAAKAISFLP
ncbi:dethiobiotin synthetase [Anseongella ginsenosidimutans]|uniref:ATP-dependent dethiobiotin synthetase BioD n=1 Tax=Anseongella ginsenosidimutans TaxID=496056 RepID=A0A4R3KRJ3_9SPHI|nr:dethiobiotin synthase [Anseongella ginsenosidimutans]QEC52953.1 dethiobiotin synthase [Anseongella ginsenosidimutans]TCS87351.1 dethiobiotin synthetase [Anseongella ginsenosidimutans]